MIDGKVLGGILLIAGTAIGAGMLAMPISTGVVGFSNAVTIISLTFCFMLACLFIMLEANIHSKGSNIISMAKEFLGKPGAIVAWISFLLLLYSASAAYISAGGSLLLSFDIVSKFLNHSTTSVIFAAIFGLIGFLGIRYIDILNRLFMLGLGLTYISLIFIVSPHISAENLSGSSPKLIWATIPVLILSFTSHIILPSLKQYYENDINKLKKVLIIGSIIPLIVYLIWELMLLGIIPQTGPNSLQLVARSVDPLATINNILEAKDIAGIALSNAAFSFFAIITSYLGVILSLADFIADGIKIQEDKKGRLLVILLSCAPPLLFALFSPSGFLIALSYAGVFVAILFCLLPVLIVWQARYNKNLTSEQYRFPTGKIGLAIIGLIGTGIIILQILATNGLLPKV